MPNQPSCLIRTVCIRNLTPSEITSFTCGRNRHLKSPTIGMEKKNTLPSWSLTGRPSKVTFPKGKACLPTIHPQPCSSWAQGAWQQLRNVEIDRLVVVAPGTVNEIQWLVIFPLGCCYGVIQRHEGSSMELLSKILLTFFFNVGM